MDLRDVQRAIEARHGTTDRASGLAFLVLVLQEEVGEVAEAVRRGDPRAAGEEAVDALFAALSLANAAGVDVEARLRAKFLDRSVEDVSRSWTDLPRREGP